ncbi:MAG: DUF2332 family protein, partial [Pseudomonadota bacterium]
MTLPDKISKHFHVQAKACERLGSPFTAALNRVYPAVIEADAAARDGIGRRLRDWPGDPFADALSVRVGGGLMALTEAEPGGTLAAVYPPAPLDPEALAAAVAEAFATRAEALDPWLDRVPQTNEVARSGVLLGGLLHIAARTGLPLELLEIGSSAGVNLALDAHAYDFGEGRHWGDPDDPVRIACTWTGAAPPLDAPLKVAARRGCDAHPIDARDGAARARMLVYIWPDQSLRRARAEAALLKAAALGNVAEAADALEWLPARLAEPQTAGRTRVVMHSIMWQYLPEATQTALTDAIHAAGAVATPDRPLAWIRLEADGTAASAGIFLDLWPAGVSV